MLNRATVKTSEYLLYRNSQNDNSTLFIFIHGFSGTHTEQYWGVVPENLRYLTQLSSSDLCFWGYPASKSPFANYFSLVRRSKKISSLAEVSDSLVTSLRYLCRDYGYKHIFFVGHSMGGIVGLLTARKLVEIHNNQTRGVLLLATPNSPPWLAKFLAKFGGNPHLKFMANKVDMHKLFKAIVPNLISWEISVVYVRHCLDELVDLNAEISFTDYESYNVKHHWFLEGDRNAGAMTGIVNWMIENQK